MGRAWGSGVLATVLAVTAAGASAQTEPRLFRVILPVSDVEAAVGFYSTLLGSEGRRVSPGRHYFDVGGVILAVLEPRADGDDYDPRPLLEPVYLAVDDLEERWRLASELGGLFEESNEGLPMGEIATRPWGERSFYTRDPFGNPLCFVDAATVFTGR